jgi:hypothetical protein
MAEDVSTAHAWAHAGINAAIEQQRCRRCALVLWRVPTTPAGCWRYGSTLSGAWRAAAVEPPCMPPEDDAA